MGSRTAKFEVTGRISSNNDERDDEDRAAWAELMAEVRELAKQPKYAGLDIDLNDLGTW